MSDQMWVYYGHSTSTVQKKKISPCIIIVVCKQANGTRSVCIDNQYQSLFLFFSKIKSLMWDTCLSTGGQERSKISY